jgi:type IV secretion system protein VirD4
MTLLSLAEARDGDESFMSPLDVLFEELRDG